MSIATRQIIAALTIALSAGKIAAADELPPAEHLVAEVISSGLSNPMEMSIAGDLVFIAELHGKVKVVDLVNKTTHVAAHLEVDYRTKENGKDWSWDVESGVLGIAADPNFAENQWVYVCYTKPGGESVEHDHVVSRFKYHEKKLDLASEQRIIAIPAFRDQDRIHEGGSLAFGPDGSLYISSGDNQVHTQYLYPARTSANSAVFNGKVLRVIPGENGGYTIPEGNLFPPGTPNTCPEIYVMGCRNPFRIHIDPKTEFLYWGENGPVDQYCGNLTGIDPAILPSGFDEFNQARGPGFFGWPFIIGPNDTYPTYSFEKGEVTGAFDPEKPVNYLAENTGIKELPASQLPMIWYSHPPSPDFPILGQGGASAIAGPVFYYDEKTKETKGLPAAFNHHWFIADYSRSWVKLVELDDNEDMVEIKDLPINFKFQTPINIKFNDKGQLFVLQYGLGGWEPDNGGSLVHITYDPNSAPPAISPELLTRPLRGLPETHPGTELIVKNNCSACHRAELDLFGPSFERIIERYQDRADRKKYLREKIQGGSRDVWKMSYEMPAHSYLQDEQVNQMIDAIFELEIESHLARKCDVTLENPPSAKYAGLGSGDLVDGLYGESDNFHVGWLGLEGADFIATIDLKTEQEVHELTLSTWQMRAAGLFMPPTIEWFASTDGKEFQSIATVTNDVPLAEKDKTHQFTAKVEGVKARYVKVVAKTLGTIPDDHPAAGRPTWLFVDELLVK